MNTLGDLPLAQVLGKRSRNEFQISTPNKELKKKTVPTSYPVGKLSMSASVHSASKVSDNHF